MNFWCPTNLPHSLYCAVDYILKIYNYTSWQKAKRHHSHSPHYIIDKSHRRQGEKNSIRGSIYGIRQKKHRRREGSGQEAVIWEVKEVRAVHLSCLLTAGLTHNQKQTAWTQKLGVDQLPAAYHTTAHRTTAAETTNSRHTGWTLTDNILCLPGHVRTTVHWVPPMQVWNLIRVFL